MYMKSIFFLRPGRVKPTEAYYSRFEEAIPTIELDKCTATTRVELNMTHAGGYN